MKLCVSCKGCRRECPTGVDMARMKIEVQAARMAKHGLSLHDRLVGYLPRYAPYAAKLSWLMNLRDVLPGAAKLSEAVAGFSARRSLPKWRCDVFDETRSRRSRRPRSRAVRRHLQPLLRAREPRCCARGAERRRLPRAFREACRRLVAAAVLRAHVSVHRQGGRGAAMKPSARSTRCRPLSRAACRLSDWSRAACLSFRDEVPAMLNGESARRLADNAFTFEEFLAREAAAGRLKLPLKKIADRALVHGHCHQKAFDAFSRGRNRAEAGARSQGRDRSSRAAAAWPAASATTPTPSTCRWRWASCRCCPRCARRMPAR